MRDLGRWAVIDIETTGIDPLYDEIIDVGFLEFEGTKLVKKYSSLVKSGHELSFFIKKLTGISDQMLRKAPLWHTVEPEVMDLYGATLLAHNAEFEEKFLSSHFERISDGSTRESYEDSLLFLSILFPGRSSLKLEKFIKDWGIADKEMHRGFEDSVDLLKVLLTATALIKLDEERFTTISHLFRKYQCDDYWYYNFFLMPYSELEVLAGQIDFDLAESVNKAIIFEQAQAGLESEMDGLRPKFPLTFSGDNIKKIFQAEGTIQESMPNYRYRASQEELSLKTGQAFKNEIHAIVQAPTGTGKTLGYLIPSALYTMSEKKQVLVATGTKTLQHQAITKDVPGLRKMLGLGSDKLVVKRLLGSSNHLCELLFRQHVDEEDLLSSSRTFADNFVDLYFESLFYHNTQVDSLAWSLRGDLPFVLKMRFKEFADREKQITVDYRSCTGNSCPLRHQCTYIKGLREAKDAHIIIGNHALMFSWPRAFPRPEHIVVDEAHRIEEETTKAFTLEASQANLESMAKSLSNLSGIGSLFYLLADQEEEAGSSTPIINELRTLTLDTYQMLQDHLGPLPEIFESFFKKGTRYSELYWNELPMVDKSRPNDHLALGIYNHLDSMLYILKQYAASLEPHASRFDVKGLDNDQQIVALTRFETFLSQIDDLLAALQSLIEKKAGFTHSMRFHEREGYLLTSAPVNVGETLHQFLLTTAKSVLFTSATLGNSTGDFGARGVEWATGYSYLEPEKRFRQGFFLPAPYDYKNKTKVFLSDDTPSLHASNFVEEVMTKVIPLIKSLKGRTLLLFSARKRFEIAREILLKEFEGKLPLFIQGMGSDVVEEFKKQGEGILLGMESFGEGIDIPGDSLQFVFVDKVPDLRMDLVINDRRQFYEANIGNEFTDYYLSHRSRALHQKLGRLLRTESDRGGILIVDSRIKKWKGRTFEKFSQLMNPYELNRAPLEQAVSEIEKFILEES
jgi:ATP-dependent DNA helicase DinG